MWRPLGWNNEYEDNYNSLKIGGYTDHTALKHIRLKSKIFEAGADAMLEALREMGKEATRKTSGDLLSDIVKLEAGRLVFIPDDPI